MRFALALLLLSLPAVGGGETNLRLDCGNSLCVMPKADLQMLIQSNNANYERAQGAEAALEEQRKQCNPRKE